MKPIDFEQLLNSLDLDLIDKHLQKIEILETKRSAKNRTRALTVAASCAAVATISSVLIVTVTSADRPGEGFPDTPAETINATTDKTTNETFSATETSDNTSISPVTTTVPAETTETPAISTETPPPPATPTPLQTFDTSSVPNRPDMNQVVCLNPGGGGVISSEYGVEEAVNGFYCNDEIYDFFVDSHHNNDRETFLSNTYLLRVRLLDGQGMVDGSLVYDNSREVDENDVQAFMDCGIYAEIKNGVLYIFPTGSELLTAEMPKELKMKYYITTTYKSIYDGIPDITPDLNPGHWKGVDPGKFLVNTFDIPQPSESIKELMDKYKALFKSNPRPEKLIAVIIFGDDTEELDYSSFDYLKIEGIPYYAGHYYWQVPVFAVRLENFGPEEMKKLSEDPRVKSVVIEHQLEMPISA